MRKPFSATSRNGRSLDIIVPVYKNAHLVRICVDSLRENLEEIQELSPTLILINDSPGDDAVEQLLASYAGRGAVVIRNDVNMGFVKSVNRGLELSIKRRHDVLLVNSDTQVFAGTLAELVRATLADPMIGFACPRSNNASICSLPHNFGGVPPTPDESHARWLALSRSMPPFHFAPTAVGFFMFISYEVIANHGCLQEEFGLGYEEENDLVMRAGKVGTRAVIVNHSFAYHSGSASFNLTDLNLGEHRHHNLIKLDKKHPEFLTLVRRYEASPHFRAERLLSGMLRDSQNRIKVVFDLRGLGLHFNGTNEQTIAVLKSMASRHNDRIALSGIASIDSFRHHGLDEIENLWRYDPQSAGVHGIAVRMAQPFDLDHINMLESLAPVNIYAMLDTIAEDCGPLSAGSDLTELWDHVASHANGIVYTSKFTEQTFCNRHASARQLPRWQCLLPTKLSDYAKARAPSEKSHILVVGNHFPHKGTDAAIEMLAAAFPTLRIVGLGSDQIRSSNVTGYRSGLIEQNIVDELFRNASVVVLPSYIEGFGFGFMHALAAGRPIVARRIPATEEILASLDEVSGVYLFEKNSDLIDACSSALQQIESVAKDTLAGTWDDWADGFVEFCLGLADRDDIFPKLVSRISAGDSLRRARLAQALQPHEQAHRPPSAPISSAKAVDFQTLIALDGKEFIESAYATLLCRPADEEGLRAYMQQLKLGVDKIALLEALSTSSEGRERAVQLEGLSDALARRAKTRRRWFS